MGPNNDFQKCPSDIWVHKVRGALGAGTAPPGPSPRGGGRRRRRPAADGPSGLSPRGDARVLARLPPADPAEVTPAAGPTGTLADPRPASAARTAPIGAPTPTRGAGASREQGPRDVQAPQSASLHREWGLYSWKGDRGPQPPAKRQTWGAFCHPGGGSLAGGGPQAPPPPPRPRAGPAALGRRPVAAGGTDTPEPPARGRRPGPRAAGVQKGARGSAWTTSLQGNGALSLASACRRPAL